MEEKFSRTALLLGSEAVERLSEKRVAVFGVGGVGGYIAEALARSGVGSIDVIDNDTISESNINRQIIALSTNVGKSKALAVKERILQINPDCNVREYEKFFLPENADEFDFECYDYVADAIDTVSGKIALVMKCREKNVPVISSMGAGNKLDPTKFEVTDIYKTTVCPLARVMRRELRKRGVEKLKVVYSTEPPVVPENVTFGENGKAVPGSCAFVPSVAGLIMAGEIIKDLVKK